MEIKVLDHGFVKLVETWGSEEQIIEEFDKLPMGTADWVILSGGNPALWELGVLVAALQRKGYKVAVETQGSIWRNWLADVDWLTAQSSRIK